MVFQALQEKYNFQIKQVEQNVYIEFKTDFEIIFINTSSYENFFLKREELIRFIDMDLEDDYEVCEDNIPPIYFLPSHKEDELIESLNDKYIVEDIEEYYTEFARESFEKRYASNILEQRVKHGKRDNHATSFYGVEEDEASLGDLIKAGKDLLELNGMKDHKIAVGSILEDIGLLERGKKIKTNNPQTKHFSFWKIDKRITGKGFSAVCENFVVIQ